jgi:hypothetical protein
MAENQKSEVCATNTLAVFNGKVERGEMTMNFYNGAG